MKKPKTYREWCAVHECTHAHCPDGCEHPQPWIAKDGDLYCGRCAFAYDEMVRMIPCNAEMCGE